MAGVVGFSGTGHATASPGQTQDVLRFCLERSLDTRSDREVLDDLLYQVSGATAAQKKVLADAFRVLLETKSGNMLLRNFPKGVQLVVVSGKEEGFFSAYSFYEKKIALNQIRLKEEDKDLLAIALAHEIGHAIQNAGNLNFWEASGHSKLSPFQIASLNKLSEAEMAAYSLDAIFQIKKDNPSFFKDVFKSYRNNNGFVYSENIYNWYQELYELNRKEAQTLKMQEEDTEAYARRKTMGMTAKLFLSSCDTKDFFLQKEKDSWEHHYNWQAVCLAEAVVQDFPEKVSSAGDDELYDGIIEAYARRLFLPTEELREILTQDSFLLFQTYLPTAVVANYENGASVADFGVLREEISKTEEYQQINRAFFKNSPDISVKAENYPIIALSKAKSAGWEV